MWSFEKNQCEKIDKEEWKECTYPSIEKGSYSVSSYGRIKNNETGKILKPYTLVRDIPTENVYYIIKLKCYDFSSKTIKYKNFRLHRLIAWEFCSRDGKMDVVEHINDNKLDNYYKNLKWSSYGENTRNAIKTNRLNICGEHNIHSVYKESFIRSICKLMDEGKTNKEILLILDGENATIRKNSATWSLICHLRSKDRFTHIACEYKYEPVINLSDDENNIIDLLMNGYENLDIMKLYGYNKISENTTLYSKILKCRKVCNIRSTTIEKVLI